MDKQTAIRHVLETDGYRGEFGAWLNDHWPIYLEFERMALFAHKQGRARLSAKFIFEMIRWNTAIREDGPYKLNGNFSADCARLVVHLHPALSGLFEFRARLAA